MPEVELACEKCGPNTPTFLAVASQIVWRCFRVLVKLLIAASFMTDVCAVVWECTISPKYYDVGDIVCQAGFLEPGEWVDDTAVPVKNVGRPNASNYHMDGGYYPDQIQGGWTLARLWRVWWCFLAFDVGATLGLALTPWRKTVSRFMRLTQKTSTLSSLTESAATF